MTALFFIVWNELHDIIGSAIEHQTEFFQYYNRNCGYYNVGTGVGTSLLDQIKGMIDVFGENGRKSDIIMRPDKPDAPQYIMDITPAVQELGYHPQYNYLEMLQDFKKEMQLHKINGGQI